MMKRILAFDVGDKRIGVAVSDALGITAQPVETYHRKGGAEKDAEYLLALAKKYAPCTLLFGLPRNMDGTYGEQAEKVKRFAQRLIDRWEGDYAFYVVPLDCPRGIQAGSNAACASLPSPRLLVADAGICATSLLGFTIGHVICGF